MKEGKRRGAEAIEGVFTVCNAVNPSESHTSMA